MMADEHGVKLASCTRSQTNNNNTSSSNNNTGSISSTSSTRWTPTTDQIRILKDLYYTHGVRSPNADQIQRISARLRQYGKIEGKNVFYWFQNHKARERQKKRFNKTNINNNNIINNTGLAPIPPASVWKHSDSSTPYVHTAAASKYPDNSQHLIYPNGKNQMTGFGYGSITMEKSFRDCSISGGGSSAGHSFGWAAGGLDHHLHHHPYAYTSQYHAVYDQRKSINNDEFHHELSVSAASDQDFFGDENRGVDMETLRLFPTHSEDSNYSSCHVNSSETDGWFHHHVGGTSASLELSLNSYAAMDRI